MKRQHLVGGVGAFALLLATAVVTMRPEPVRDTEPPATARAHHRLAAVSTAARQDIDYAALDARLQRLIAKPSMVGMAVGIVENGRITFLSGYGETVAGSGEKVTPDTVFRWASVSKGVAATMVAKLAEQGELSFNSPLVQYASSLKLPGGMEARATVGDLLSHRLG
ncbi:MAG: serine hydrolase domain-containing protein, partial [Sphingomicrobium sp.]